MRLEERDQAAAGMDLPGRGGVAVISVGWCA
jgi:hypothetical protein